PHCVHHLATRAMCPLHLHDALPIYSISENLALIKSRENLITMAGAAEGGRRPVAEINSDIAAIDRLLKENKEKIASAAGRWRRRSEEHTSEPSHDSISYAVFCLKKK